jgi:hypothetical protein
MIRIGTEDWHSALIERTNRLAHDFWADFRPAEAEDLDRIERETARKLDHEFREFYMKVGFGRFPNGGNFYSPHDILQCLPNPIFFVCGSLGPYEPWATETEHRQLWISRGRSNPAPRRFTTEKLRVGGIYLYDLLQFGTDGMCCYHQLYVGPEPAPARYCLLTPEGTAEDFSDSFSAAIDKIISKCESDC